MLEILGLILLCRKNSDNAKARGRKPGLFIFLTLALWLGLEIVFAITGGLLGLGLGLYLLAIAGAAIGAVLSYFITKNCKQGNDFVPGLQPIVQIQNTTWVFACHDHNRVSAMAMFGNTSQYFSAEHAIATVRSRFPIPQNQPVRFVSPNEWDAPSVVAAQTSFDADMTAINNKISQYLMSQGCSGRYIPDALRSLRGIPNPSLGILLLCVETPSADPQAVPAQPLPAADPPDAAAEYRPAKAFWAAAGILVLSLLILLSTTLIRNRMLVQYLFAIYTLLIPVLMGCSLFFLFQRGMKFKLFAALALVISYILEILHLQFSIMGRISIAHLFRTPVILASMIPFAIPCIIVIVVGILCMVLMRSELGKKLHITAWICSAAILIYSIILKIPQFDQVRPNILIFLIADNIIYSACLCLGVYLLYALASLKKGRLNIGTGAIVWLSICIGFTAISVIVTLAAAVVLPISLIFTLMGIAGYIALLCKRRAGFLISVFAITMSVFHNFQLYSLYQTPTAVLSVIGLINPAITWLLIRKPWIGRTGYGQDYSQISN